MKNIKNDDFKFVTLANYFIYVDDISSLSYICDELMKATDKELKQFLTRVLSSKS